MNSSYSENSSFVVFLLISLDIWSNKFCCSIENGTSSASSSNILKYSKISSSYFDSTESLKLMLSYLNRIPTQELNTEKRLEVSLFFKSRLLSDSGFLEQLYTIAFDLNSNECIAKKKVWWLFDIILNNSPFWGSTSSSKFWYFFMCSLIFLRFF